MPIFAQSKSREVVARWIESGLPLGSSLRVTHWIDDAEQKIPLSDIELSSMDSVFAAFVGADFRVNVSATGGQGEVAVLFGQVDSPVTEARDGVWTHRNGASALAELSKSAFDFGCGCCWDEWMHRHLVEVETAWSSKPSTMCCGKDASRYVPGLYFLTYMSESYIREHGVCPSAVARQLNASMSNLAHGILLQLFATPNDWREHCASIDALLKETTGFFSVRQLNGRYAHTPPELNSIFAELTEHWP